MPTAIELGVAGVFQVQSLFDAVDLTGVLANGILGAAVARALRLDLVGFLVLGITSGLGGGLMRDTVLQVPPVAFNDPAYLITALIGSAVGYLVPFDSLWARRVLVVADALALGCWSAIGALKAVDAGLAPVPAVLIGLMTAVGGGMVRDILVGRVPAVLGGNTLYAVPAVTGSVVMVVGAGLDAETPAFGAAILITAAFALLARARGWQLPGEAPRLRLPRRATHTSAGRRAGTARTRRRAGAAAVGAGRRAGAAATGARRRAGHHTGAERGHGTGGAGGRGHAGSPAATEESR